MMSSTVCLSVTQQIYWRNVATRDIHLFDEKSKIIYFPIFSTPQTLTFEHRLSHDLLC